jgi:hypothetical protein
MNMYLEYRAAQYRQKEYVEEARRDRMIREMKRNAPGRTNILAVNWNRLLGLFGQRWPTTQDSTLRRRPTSTPSAST